MKNNFIAIALGVVAIVIAAGALYAANSTSGNFGNTTQSFWDAQQGFKVNGTTIVNSSRVATLVGLTVTTTNTATSTSALGCIQTTATSTATPIRLVPTLYAGTTTVDGSTSSFLMAGQYGTCPH